MEQSKPPSLIELTQDIEIAYKNDQLNLLLNQRPPEAWIKTNKFAGNSAYLPIDKVEHLLTKIFQQWRCEVIGYSQLFNAVSCHIRLHYVHPINGQWSFHDGVGAAQIQTKAGASPADLASINNNAVAMALPIAKSYALKDASHHLGKLFGKDLNRKDVLEFSPTFDNISIEDLKALFETVKAKLSISEIKSAERIINNQEKASYKKLLQVLTDKQ